jgi:hypothetical protein
MHFAHSGVVQYECLGFGRNTINISFRISARDEIAIAVECHRNDVRFIGIVKRFTFAIRTDPVDDAFVAGAYKQTTLFVKNQGPDVFLIRIVELRRRSTRFNAIDFPIRRRAGIKDVLAVDRQGKNIKFRHIRDYGAAARSIHPKNFTVVARAKINIALRIRDR